MGRIQLMPQPSSLAHVNATVFTPRGPISLHVKQAANFLSLGFQIPSGTGIAGIKVCLPPPHGVSKEAASTLVLNGVRVQTVAQGRLLCIARGVLPGQYLALRTVNQ